MSKTISQQWAEYAAVLKFEDIPPSAVREAKRFLLDTIGCALGGSQVQDCEIALDVMREMGGRPEATIIGWGEKTNVMNAVLLNSLMVRAMDYNDVYWKQDPSHPSDIIPAALGVGEREHRTGKEVITAIIIAYDLEMRLCEAAHPGIREIGWHHATFTQFASAPVAGKMLGLNPEQMVNSIGISGSHNGSLGAVTAGELTMMKNTVDPMAVQSSVLAALLAQKGYVGPTAIFEGREGLFEQINVEWKPDVLTKGLGSEYKIVDCSMKGYPTEALTHAPISATLDLIMEHDIKPDDVESVLITTIARAAEILADPSKYNIGSKETADHSLPYCIAAAIADQEVTPRQFKPEKLIDRQILALVNKVNVKTSQEFEEAFPAKQPCQVEIRTLSGYSLTKRVEYPRGDPRDPLTGDQIKNKFSALAEKVLSADRQESVFQLIDGLESVEDIGLLMEKLVS